MKFPHAGRVSVLTCEELVWIHHIFEELLSILLRCESLVLNVHISCYILKNWNRRQNHFRWVVFVSVKNTYEQYLKFDYMRISHMRVKWNEIRYIPNRYQFFAGWEDLVPIIHIRTLRNVKFVVQKRVPIFVNSTHLKKNCTSSSQTLYEFLPSETEDV